MRTKLFISNLDFEVQQEELEELFKEVGDYLSVVVARDRETRRSKGFAFVEMGSEEGAERAIEQLNNRELNGRPIKVSYDRGKDGGDAGGGRGGFRGASGGPGAPRRPEILPPIQRMQLFRRRRKIDPFLEDPSRTVDYRDASMLTKYVSERGKILSRRLTGLTAYNQRKVAKAIKKAQHLGLMPFRNQ